MKKYFMCGKVGNNILFTVIKSDKRLIFIINLPRLIRLFTLIFTFFTFFFKR